MVGVIPWVRFRDSLYEQLSFANSQNVVTNVCRDTSWRSSGHAVSKYKYVIFTTRPDRQTSQRLQLYNPSGKPSYEILARANNGKILFPLHRTFPLLSAASVPQWRELWRKSPRLRSFLFRHRSSAGWIPSMKMFHDSFLRQLLQPFKGIRWRIILRFCEWDRQRQTIFILRWIKK